MICCGLVLLVALLAKAGSGRHAFDSLTDELTFHFRVAAAATATTEFEISWLAAGDTAVARVKVSPYRQADEILGGEISYTVHCGDSLHASGVVLSDYARNGDKGVSAVLKAKHAGASLSIGGSHADANVAVPFDFERPQQIGYSAGTGVNILRKTLISEGYPEPEYAPFDGVEALMEYLGASSDPKESLWQYLDRDICISKAALGGKYALATVAAGEGNYDIYYLDGAEKGKALWGPLRLKGRLKGTIFRDHYDLEWLDSRGRPVKEDTHADFSGECTVLELKFPLQESSLRFRKASMSAREPHGNN